MKKKNIIILMVLILLPLCVLGGIKLYRAIDDKYAAIDYAVKGSGYSVKSVNTYEDHLVYVIQGEGDYLGIKHRYEEYLKSHPDSFLNNNCPIEIVFRCKPLRGGVLIVSNFVPDTIHHTELVTTFYPDKIHDRLDVAYVDDFGFANDNSVFEGSEYENDIEILVDDDSDSTYRSIMLYFPNIKRLYVPSSFDRDALKEVLPDCECFGMDGMHITTDRFNP